MAVVAGQAVIGTAVAPALAITAVPPGPCQVTVTVGTAAAAATLYVGTSTTVTTTNGAPVTTNGPVTFVNYEGSPAVTLYGVASAASTPVGFIISTPR